MAFFQSDHPSVGRRLFSCKGAAFFMDSRLAMVRLSRSLASRGYLLNVIERKNVGHALRFGVLPDVTLQVLTQ